MPTEDVTEGEILQGIAIDATEKWVYDLKTVS